MINHPKPCGPVIDQAHPARLLRVEYIKAWNGFRRDLLDYSVPTLVSVLILHTTEAFGPLILVSGPLLTPGFGSHSCEPTDPIATIASGSLRFRKSIHQVPPRYPLCDDVCRRELGGGTPRCHPQEFSCTPLTGPDTPAHHYALAPCMLFAFRSLAGK